jgi:hypothetical protein
MAPTSGRFSWGILLCKFSDQPNNEPKRPQFFRDLVSGQAFGNLAAYWQIMSYGKLDMSNPDVYGWITMPFPLDDAFRSLSRSQKTQKCIDAVSTSLAGNAAALQQLSANNGFLVVINEIIDSGADGSGRILLDAGAWNPTFIPMRLGMSSGSITPSIRVLFLGMLAATAGQAPMEKASTFSPIRLSLPRSRAWFEVHNSGNLPVRTEARQSSLKFASSTLAFRMRR